MSKSNATRATRGTKVQQENSSVLSARRAMPDLSLRKSEVSTAISPELLKGLRFLQDAERGSVLRVEDPEKNVMRFFECTFVGEVKKWR